MNRSRIPWLVNADGTKGYTWSPMTGCGPGLPCYDRCWARLYHVRYRGGDFSVKLHPEKLDEPLRLRKPSTIGVCLMGDLFHRDVPRAFREDVIVAMASADRHTYILLTKRPATAYAETRGRPDYLGRAWLGVSVENRETKNRIDVLRDTPSAHRWISLEPQIEDVGELDLRGINLVVQGCESGPRRRPFDIAWARAVRDQCKAAGVPYYLKQLEQEVRGGCNELDCDNYGDCDKNTEEALRCRVAHPRSLVVEKPYLDGRQHLDLPWTVTP